MPELFSLSSGPPLSIEAVLSVFSAAMTAYFWLVRARREKPQLTAFQLANFRLITRKGDEEKHLKRVSITQLERGGVLVANHSIRQNSIVRFDCYLRVGHDWVKGLWGYIDNDKPPWNIGPESTIAMSPACFFEVPEDAEIAEDFEFYIEFITVSGHRFPQLFHKQAPEL